MTTLDEALAETLEWVDAIREEIASNALDLLDRYDLIVAAARNWHTLPDQVDVVAQAIKPHIDVDPAIDPNEWGLAQLHTARIAAKAALDALTVTAEEEK